MGILATAGSAHFYWPKQVDWKTEFFSNLLVLVKHVTLTAPAPRSLAGMVLSKNVTEPGLTAPAQTEGNFG